jgi:hypothetical protein
MSFDCYYEITGNGTDNIKSRITLDGVVVSYKEQRFGFSAGAGSGTRSNVIFPLFAASPNTTTSSRTIRIQVNMSNVVSDSLVLFNDFWTFELLERKT